MGTHDKSGSSSKKNVASSSSRRKRSRSNYSESDGEDTPPRKRSGRRSERSSGSRSKSSHRSRRHRSRRRSTSRYRDGSDDSSSSDDSSDRKGKKKKQSSRKIRNEEYTAKKVQKKALKVGKKLKSNTVSRCSNDSNPSDDANLNGTFLGRKKIYRDVTQGKSLDEFTVEAEKERQIERMGNVFKLQCQIEILKQLGDDLFDVYMFEERKALGFIILHGRHNGIPKFRFQH